ncbi:DUF6456 domain-containing protein [Microvirga antarctica]|uniref:DUF6456 domain-containing protein n=1 Tax=Microvirga antarctica TaxID=2819233 RepID=UPI001FECD321|nr:DUF6456 domain-containing protein [Microvirga antarctica]
MNKYEHIARRAGEADAVPEVSASEAGNVRISASADTGEGPRGSRQNTRPPRAASTRGKRKIGSHEQAPAGGRPSGGLSPAALRLLASLGKPDAFALVDPSDEGCVILRGAKAAVSLSAGRFARSDADRLVRQDLARWQGERLNGLSITAVGKAYLRRARAPAGETGFFDQHHETASLCLETAAGVRRVRVDLDESPLDWLRRRKGPDGQRLIGEAAFEAGERLRRDLMMAGLLPGVTARWDGMPAGKGGASPSEATDRMVAARQRVRHAFEAIGSEFGDLLFDLCGFLKGLELIERERGWPQRSGKVVVRLALTRLADHYGIENAARGPAASRGIRAWQAVVSEGGLR